MNRILIVTSCTGEKKYQPDEYLIQDDFRDPVRKKAREEELKDWALPAKEMYTGMQHLRLIEGVAALRNCYGSENVDLVIVSAGYGLISENHQIIPYEVTFNSMKRNEVNSWSEFLGIHAALEAVLPQYKMVIFLLGTKYLQAIQLPFANVKPEQRLIFLSSKTNQKMIPKKNPYFIVDAGLQQALDYSFGLIGLKGLLFELFAKEVESQGSELLLKVIDNPEKEFVSIIQKHILNKYKSIQEPLFTGQMTEEPKIIFDFYLQNNRIAPNNHRGLKYFIPECDDLVDPKFDFLNDQHSKGRTPYIDDYYAHQFFPRPNYDGLLVSKLTVDGSKKKKDLINTSSIRSYTRFNDMGPIMGDCGAWGYVKEECPPYTTEEILDYYEALGFDIGVSIDHLIGPKMTDMKERTRRYKITRDNAYDFLISHKKGNFRFTPSGIAQGWDQKSYYNAVSDLIEMGYKHISLGGLALRQDKDILAIMQAISPLVIDDLDIHLFGVGRLDVIKIAHRLGITSFDCARPIRQAWGGARSNYYGIDGKNYSAIRIPQHNRFQNRIANGDIGFSKEQVAYLERQALKALREYDKGQLSINKTLEAVLEYDVLVGDSRSKHRELYQEVLEDEPWKKCDCAICRNAGVEVIIFRGNNRNRRRGFHNTYIYYKRLLQHC